MSITMPTFLNDWLRTRSPQQADELWLYFDGCTNQGIIEICQEVALRDPVIRKRENESKGYTQKGIK